MAKKPVTSTGYVEKKPSRVKLPFGNLTFVLNNLDEGQHEELSSFENNPPNLLDFMTDCVDKGLDVKTSYDAYSDGYQAIASGNWDNFPSAGFACSGFSKHGTDDALFVLWYKVAVICQFDLSTAKNREKRTRERG